MALNDLYRCAFSYQIFGQTNTNIMYMKQTAQPLLDTAQKVADSLVASMTTVFAAGVPVDNRNPTSNLTVQLVSRIFSDAGIASGAFGNAGMGGGSLPPANALVVRIGTGLAGRTRRGRIFLGGVQKDLQGAGVLTANGIIAYGIFLTAMRNQFGGPATPSGFQLGVFSRKRYDILSNPFDDYWKPATVLAIVSGLTTMRSRKVGSGS